MEAFVFSGENFDHMVGFVAEFLERFVKCCKRCKEGLSLGGVRE